MFVIDGTFWMLVCISLTFWARNFILHFDRMKRAFVVWWFIHKSENQKVDQMEKFRANKKDWMRFIFSSSSWHFITHIMSNTMWWMLRSADKSPWQVGLKQPPTIVKWTTNKHSFMRQRNFHGVPSRTCSCCLKKTTRIRDGAWRCSFHNC